MNEKGQGDVGLLLTLGILAIIAYLIIMALIPSAVQAGDAIKEIVVDVPVSNIAPAPPKVDVPDYAEIPLTHHAANSHEGQLWNATRIQKYFAAGGCIPKIDICKFDDVEIHYCEINMGKSIALVIGNTVRQIVSGFMAPTSYWQDRCST